MARANAAVSIYFAFAAAEAAVAASAASTASVTADTAITIVPAVANTETNWFYVVFSCVTDMYIDVSACYILI